MMRIILVLASLAFSAGTAKKIVLPSGQAGYSIRCDNENVNACYERAGDVCHRGYTIENRETQIGEESASGGYIGPGFVPGTTIGAASAVSATTSEKGFLITCKDPEVTEFERIQREKRAQEIEERERARAARGARIFLGVSFGVVLLTFLTMAIAAK